MMKTLILVTIGIIVLLVVLLVWSATAQDQKDKKYIQDHQCSIKKDIEGIIKVYSCADGTEIVR
jgi:hypothetical protein